MRAEGPLGTSRLYDARSREPLRVWQRRMQRGEFANLHELREAWPRADLVNTMARVPVIVFNIGGNKYRLIVNITWLYKTVFIKRVFTHVEYDDWSRKGRPL